MHTIGEVTGLYVYPIKSCAGIALENAQLDARGIVYDRRWMVVSDDEQERGLFLSQRELPQMALIQPALSDETLIVRAPRLPELWLPLTPPANAKSVTAIVWDDTCLAYDEGDEAAGWLTRHLGVPARLVRMADAFVRPVDPQYASAGAQTAFSDGYPALITAQASLDDLNARLAARGKAAVSMLRFRPNIVIGGCAPYAEDGWQRVQIGAVAFDIVKPCKRCAITTVDPASGSIPDREEPLATLAAYRRGPRGGVLFGQNAVHRALGKLALGDRVTQAAAEF